MSQFYPLVFMVTLLSDRSSDYRLSLSFTNTENITMRYLPEYTVVHTIKGNYMRNRNEIKTGYVMEKPARVTGSCDQKANSRIRKLKRRHKIDTALESILDRKQFHA